MHANLYFSHDDNLCFTLNISHIFFHIVYCKLLSFHSLQKDKHGPSNYKCTYS